MNENNLTETESTEVELNKPNMNELNLDELREYLKNTDPKSIDLDEMLNTKLLVDGSISINEFTPGLIAVLRADDKMISDSGRPYQVGSKTSRGNKILYNALPGSNHDKVDDLLDGKEKALQANVSIAFSDNITVIENSLDAIKSQVQAISKGIKAEESRYKAKFIDPLNVKINELTEDMVNGEILQAQVDMLVVENGKLVKEVEKLTAINENSQSIMITQKESINELTAESRDLMKSNKLMSEKIDDLNKVREEELSDLRKEYEGDLATKDATIDGLNKRIESLDLELTQQSKTERSLRDEIKILKDDKLETENNLKREILDLVKAKNEVEFKVSSLTMEKDTLKNENTSLNSSIDDFKSTQKELEDNVNQLSIAKNSLEVRVKSLDDLISSHNKTIETKTNTINTLERQLKEQTSLRQEREHEISKLGITIENQVATIQKLQQMLDAFNNTQNKVDTPKESSKTNKK